jgi:uncharacterized protein YbdZ (MbtH family)
MSPIDAEVEDRTVYKVVLNHEEQYSIWPADRENPLGWFDAGKSGSKVDCLDHIKEVWTDMRPLSLRKAMEEEARLRAEQPEEPLDAESDEPVEETLVERLARGDHPVILSLRPERTLAVFKERLDLGYIHVKFTDTRGGTELGFPIDKDALDLSSADLEHGGGTVRLSGPLTLDYVKIRCVADIDLATLEGRGRVEIVPA